LLADIVYWVQIVDSFPQVCAPPPVILGHALR
jgi:hypothetical protein